MKRNLRTALIVNLAICIVCALFMSSCSSCERQRQQKEEEQRYQELMDKITPNTFEPYLTNYAEEICLERYYRNGNRFLGWIIDESSMRGEITLEDKADGKGKIGRGTVHVKMTGAGGSRLRNGSADVVLSGILNINSDGSLSFVKGADYHLENIVHLDRMEDVIEDIPDHILQ